MRSDMILGVLILESGILMVFLIAGFVLLGRIIEAHDRVVGLLVALRSHETGAGGHVGTSHESRVQPSAPTPDQEEPEVPLYLTDEIEAAIERRERETAGASSHHVCSYWDEEDEREAIEEDLNIHASMQKLGLVPRGER